MPALIARRLKTAVRPLVGPVLGRALDWQASALAASCRAAPAPAPGRDRLHVGLLCSAWDQAHYGITVWTRVLAEALAAGGHRVVVFRHATAEAGELLVNGVRIVTVTADPWRRWPALPPFWPWLAEWQRGVTAAILRRHRRDRFDIVSGPIWPVEPLALLETGAVPVAISLHTTETVTAAPGGEGDPQAQALAEAERTLFLRAPLLISNTAATARDLAARLGEPVAPERLAIVPHGMPDVAGAAHGEAPDPPQLLYLGQLGFRKGIDTLLEALPSLLAARTAAVMIAGAPQGESPEPGFRARHAGAPWLSRVHFLGLVEEARKRALLAASAVVVIPSRYESFGLVSLEAMMFGKPVVSTLAGGIPEVVEHGVTGLLVPPADPPSLAAALGTLLDDAAMRSRMGGAGRARYLARFTDMAMAEAWLRAIRGAAAAGAAPPQPSPG